MTFVMLWGACSGRGAALQVADSANSMGAGGLKAEAGSRSQCRKIAGDVHNMGRQTLLIEP